MAQAYRDERLEGLWLARVDKTNWYLYIAYTSGSKGVMTAFGSDETAPGAVTWSFFVTPTPKHTYLNLVELSELSRGKARVFTRQKFSFMQYRFDWRRRLVLSNVGGDIFSKAVKFYWKPPG